MELSLEIIKTINFNSSSDGKYFPYCEKDIKSLSNTNYRNLGIIHGLSSNGNICLPLINKSDNSMTVIFNKYTEISNLEYFHSINDVFIRIPHICKYINNDADLVILGSKTILENVISTHIYPINDHNNEYFSIANKIDYISGLKCINKTGDTLFIEDKYYGVINRYKIIDHSFIEADSINIQSDNLIDIYCSPSGRFIFTIESMSSGIKAFLRVTEYEWPKQNAIPKMIFNYDIPMRNYQNQKTNFPYMRCFDGPVPNSLIMVLEENILMISKEGIKTIDQWHGPLKGISIDSKYNLHYFVDSNNKIEYRKLSYNNGYTKNIQIISAMSTKILEENLSKDKSILNYEIYPYGDPNIYYVLSRHSNSMCFFELIAGEHHDSIQYKNIEL